ncbi:MAG: hypothetical protein WA294_04650, partial [Acidobacteriaceae bacterium]
MAKEICISSTPHETRLAILEDDQLAEIYYERENEYTLAGSIYTGRVTRVLPGMQSAFVDLGLERDAFLYVTDFLEEQEEDSADFDRVESGESGRRAGEANGNGRRQREPREPREQRPQPQESETSDLQASETAPRRTEREPQHGEDEGDSGTRRWRGRRGRRFRGRGPRDDRQSSDRPSSRTSGAADLSSPGFVDEAITAEPIAQPERGAPGGIPAQNLPIVLPGESLSKYGGRSEIRTEVKPATSAAPARRAGPLSTAKPSTLVDVPTGWDGGVVLPGESLSRHRRSESRRSSRTEPSASAAEIDATPADRGTVVLESDSGFDSASSFLEQGAQPASLAPVAEAPEPRVQPETAWSAEPLESAEPITEQQAVAAAAEPHAEATPATARAESAPAASAAQHEIAAATGLAAHDPESIEEEVREYEPDEASASHRVEPARSEMRFSAPLEEEEIEEEEHQPSADHGAAPQESAAPVADGQAASPEAEVVRQLFGYAPGMGVLEEETIDEDEYDFEPIQGEADEHGPEEMEEETLDQAATTGDALRDVHIDARLGYSSPAEASEDEETSDLDTGFAETDEEDESAEDEGEEEFEEAGTEAAEEPVAGAEAPVRER